MGFKYFTTENPEILHREQQRMIIILPVKLLDAQLLSIIH